MRSQAASAFVLFGIGGAFIWPLLLLSALCFALWVVLCIVDVGRAVAR